MGKKSIVTVFLTTLVIFSTLAISAFSLILLAQIHKGDEIDHFDHDKNSLNVRQNQLHNSLKKIDGQLYDLLEPKIDYKIKEVENLISLEGVFDESLTTEILWSKLMDLDKNDYFNYVLTTHSGDIIYDETNQLGHSLLELKSIKDLLLIDKNELDMLENIQVNLDLNSDESFLFLKPVDSYYLGIVISKETASTLLFDYLDKTLNLLKKNHPEYDYAIYDFEGSLLSKDIRDALVISRESLNKLILEDQFSHGDVDKIIHYDIYHELNIVILSLVESSVLPTGLRHIQMVDFLKHMSVILLMIFASIIFVRKFSKKINQDMAYQIKLINYGVSHGESIDLSKMLFNEFSDIAALVNRSIRKDHINETEVLQKKQTHINTFTLIQYLKKTMIPFNHDELETFNISKMMNTYLMEVLLVDEVEVEILCDETLTLRQNKLYLKGLMKFFLLMTLMTIEENKQTVITIEVISDEVDVNISMSSTNHGVRESLHKLSHYDDLQVLTQRHLMGNLDVSKITEGDNRVVIKCALKR